MKSMLRTVNSHGQTYTSLMFVCPGCVGVLGGSGLHMLPVNCEIEGLCWIWDGNLEQPTLSPSILTGGSTEDICHSFLREGVFKFLNDSTHSLAGKYAPIPDLPDWVISEGETS